MATVPALPNYINGAWRASAADRFLNVVNPATAQVIGKVPSSSAAEVDEAVRQASVAFPAWRRTPAGERIQYLFKLKGLIEEHIDELATIITNECGKTRAEAVAELRRAIENAEVACGAPTLMQGWNNEDIAAGIDEHCFRQPLGVVAAITPFNFPAMIPMWFLPYALACGNCFILKPSEKVPLTSVRLFELLEKTGLPKGVAQLVHGAKETVDALLDHPGVRAVSFVGSSPAAKYVYGRAAANGKRAQCSGGAKNPIVILPDADVDMTTQIVADSAFGCAGQRCLAASLAVVVGDAGRKFTPALRDVAANRRVGYGLDEGVHMGPVITAESRGRIEKIIAAGRREGAQVLVDGAGKKVKGYEEGNFIFPTIFDNVNPRGDIARTEIFGPVLSLTNADNIDDAIAIINSSNFGNMACLFTSSGAAARKFRYECAAGNIGINIGVAAPMAFYAFGGAKDSFYGDLHPQGKHAIEFYTEVKVVVERWPKEWSRAF